MCSRCPMPCASRWPIRPTPRAWCLAHLNLAKPSTLRPFLEANMSLSRDCAKTFHDLLAVGGHDMRTRLLAACIHHSDGATCCMNVDSDVFVHGGPPFGGCLFFANQACPQTRRDSTATFEHPLGDRKSTRVNSSHLGISY